MRLPARNLALLGIISALSAPAAAQPFVDVTTAAGLVYVHGYLQPLAAPDGSFDEARHFAGGVAAGDYDNDGYVDIFASRGDIGPSLLFRNRGDGTFTEVGAAAGVDLVLNAAAGPVFADIDGDGWLDLFIGGVKGSGLLVLRNRGDGTFADVTAMTGIDTTKDTYSAACGDFDGDGDLDLALAHWATLLRDDESPADLWRNEGDFRFSDVSIAAGTAAAIRTSEFGFRIDFSFTPSFSDINADGWPDLLFAGDFNQSRVLLNDGAGRLIDATDLRVFTDENAMGSAIGDYDNDGNLDWFVSSIWDPAGATIENWGVTGNRLYRGLGDGTFEDVTDAAGVRVGYWGWAASWGDLDDDGHLDLVQVNGMGRSAEYEPTQAFFRDPTRVFMSNGDGTFVERSAAIGLAEDGMGRGLVVFDFDRDGDLDVLIANSGGPPRLFRNDRGTDRHHLGIRLRGRAPNTEAAGARVTVRAGGMTQLREIRIGSNFASQNPAEAHFGLGASLRAEEVTVRWPSGARTLLTDVEPTALLELQEPLGPPSPSPCSSPTPPPACPGDCDGNGAVTVDEIVRAVAIALGQLEIAACLPADAAGDGTVTVDEIVRAVAAALGGCAGRGTVVFSSRLW